MISFQIDPTVSSLTVRTRAVGFLAKLAKDLELSAGEISGFAIVQDDGAWRGELVIPIASLRVAGVVTGERVDVSSPSQADRLEVERKIREEVFPHAKEVRARLTGASRESAEAHVEIGAGQTRIHIRLDASEGANGTRVTGACSLSLKALAIAEVKGPLGAFKLKDEVEVAFVITLRAEDSPRRV